MSTKIYVNDVFGIPVFMAHNVPAVTEVWAGIQGLCEAKTAAANLPE